MLHLIKMELYRFIHTKAVWVIAIVLAIGSVAMSALLLATSAYLSETSSSTQIQAVSSSEYETEGDADTSGLNLYFTVNDETVESTFDDNDSKKIELGSFIATFLQDSFLPVFFTIFAAVFAYADKKSGYIKNLAGHFPNRQTLVLAKFFAIAVGVLAMMIVYLAAGSLTFLIGGYRFYLESAGQLLQLLGVHYLLNLAFAAVVYLITELVRSSAAGITIGILLASGIGSILYSCINLLVSKVTPESTFDASQYGLDTMLAAYGLNMTSNETIHAVALGLVYGILAIGLTILVARKRDIC